MESWDSSRPERVRWAPLVEMELDLPLTAPLLALS